MEDFKLLISFLRNDESINYDVDTQKLYSISKAHNVLPIFYSACLKYNISLPTQIFQYLEKSYKNAVYQEAVRDVELNEILKLFDQNNIKCMPLKGSILKKLYPSPELRTMCDVDILYDDKNNIIKLLSSLGYKLTHKSNHHDVYEKPPFMNVEMHHHLISEDFNIIREYYDNIWSVVTPLNENSNIYRMTNEDFYIFMISHIAKHFQYGGIGIRYVFDEYVFLKKYESVLDFEYINHELSKIYLAKFEENFRKLMKIWFYDENTTEFYEEMGTYILESYVHGSTKHVQMLNMAIGDKGQNVLKSNKFKYILNRMFPNYNQMKYRNPILKKIPILLPIFYIERLITGAFKKKRQTYYEITGLQKFNTEKAVKVQNMKKEMEFKNSK